MDFIYQAGCLTTRSPAGFGSIVCVCLYGSRVRFRPVAGVCDPGMEAFVSMKAFPGLTEATGLAYQLHDSSKCV